MRDNPPPSTAADLVTDPDMPSTIACDFPDELPSSSLFDWSDFLDFELDDSINLSFEPTDPQQNIPLPDSELEAGVERGQSQETDIFGRVRKRDPRLVCPNFLAGRIPCECPELDEKLEAEETGGVLPGKKRVRSVRVSGGAAPARCQVPECEADISELKGYHKRHRICLRCANASSVVLDGESKRYCQQCGKFHILSDFDEGKRSCRRKLERHNNRRRRKPNDAKGSFEMEPQQVTLADNVGGDDDTLKDMIHLSSQMPEREIVIESEGHASTLSSALGSQNIPSKSVLSADFVETHHDEDKENPKYTNSTSCRDNKSVFSSLCPTGRISFKLYDWNPAEFPRRLRHQIFEWLTSMPVELEGYIRPGCTILTAFVAMPKFMWVKLLEESAVRIQDLVVSPGNMLSGRGTMLVYLNDMIFRVSKDGASVVKVKVKGQAPKIHYIHPTCFEAGKPLEFIACGSNLLQPKFRFLVSFAGRYLAYDISVSSISCENEGNSNSLDHQLLKIHVPHTDPDIFGPAFIEVENQSGLSNFIPILIGDKPICEEMAIMQQKFDTSLCSDGHQFADPTLACEVYALRKTEYYEFLLEVAWLLKDPVLELHLTVAQIQRINYLLNFLIERGSTVILYRVLSHMKTVMDKYLVTGVPDADMILLWKILNNARTILCQKLQEKDYTVTLTRVTDGNDLSQTSQNDLRIDVQFSNQGSEKTAKDNFEARIFSSPLDESATIPLLSQEVVTSLNSKGRPGKPCSRLFTKTFLISRPVIFAIVAISVCSGICAVILHPQRVVELGTTLRRCLFNN
ncbi:squamosa promoter-binding-like protein 7 [Olea europaea var. sylvestris]|uniref:squamosa promoter-binding-like protein 7 n=1 Tax=Olea europaea var. sylvestris TaxID=158386 RepID=UPI000C1D2F3C|nr:squamosa promoter-binding-like protein 7 [Olea europaea var. sylvestris]